MTVFSDFAEYYDFLYGQKDYVEEVEYVCDLIEEYSPGAKTVLDLGCGTGAHVEHLANKGFDVVGVDLSREMLMKAENRLQRLPTETVSRLKFHHGDVRKIRLGETFDVVALLFHVICYQTSDDDLIRTLETVKKHLNPGGILIFDFWHGPGVSETPPEVRVKRVSNDEVDIVRIAEPTHIENQNVIQVDYDLFVKKAEGNKVYVRTSESHSMRFLFEHDINALFAQTGFKMLAVFEWQTREKPDAKTWSACCVARL